MSRFGSLRCLIGLLLMLGVSGAVSAKEALSYHGFVIDDSRVQKAKDHDEILAATREQIDMVLAVGLPAEVVTFFESVKFELMPDGSFASATPGRYTGRTSRSVQVVAAIVRTGHKPVLLHELLHAYHDQRVSGGFNNREIRRLYENARSLPAFSTRSHMMSNEKEFFACGATTYLFGVTAQEPFTRDKLAKTQPEFFAYLQKLFGAGTGTYEGSLTRQ